MIDGKTSTGIGAPLYEGLYAVETAGGWRILQWGEGWWFPERTAKWGADIPSRWVGPMPAARPTNKPAAFDL